MTIELTTEAARPVETETLAPKHTKKIGFISLGCPKNLVDSEVMMGILAQAGATITSDAGSADVLVVNTCSFIDKAKQESVDTILEMARHKTEGNATRLVVAGCMVERYRDEIRKNIPEVDAVVGTGELEQILAAAGIAAPQPERDCRFAVSNSDIRRGRRFLSGQCSAPGGRRSSRAAGTLFA